MSTRESPIFLVGSERSGTTLLRLMLDHHPEIAFNLESQFLVTQISDAGAFPDVAIYRSSLSDDRIFRHSRFLIDERLDFAALLNDFLRQKRERDGKKVVGATVHHQFSKLRYVWPEARFIHIVRDGRDVANSVVEMGWAGNPYVAADWWLRAEREWDALRGRLTADRWIEVRYEDLTADPTAHLRRICAFCGVEYSERMFDYVGNTSYSAPDPQLNEQWRRKLRPKDLRLLEGRIGTLLVERGYELSGELPAQPGTARERLIRLQSRLGTLGYRIQAYGLRIVAQDLIARRLGLAGWSRSAAKAIDRIIDQGLR